MRRSQYIPVRTLASGGMGEIVLARQHGEDGVERLVALKRVRSELVQRAGFQTLFRNEARIAARLSHPNIVQIYDFGVEDSGLFLAMEYVEGRTLSALLKRAARLRMPVDIEAILAIAIDLSRALHYAHELTDADGHKLEIVHRDLSPANIIISFEGAAKILDFGVAKASIAIDETEERTVKGKLSYLSPEQANLTRVDRRADIFTLGILLWELTTGRALFRVPELDKAAEIIGRQEIASVVDHRPGVPPGWDGVVRRALARDPDERYQTALELQHDVEQVARCAGQVASNLSVVRVMAKLFPEAVRGLAERGEEAATRRFSVLAVDDEADMRDLLRRALRRRYRVVTAESVVDAMRALSEQPFDAVVTDERMPGGRGVELLQHVALVSPRTVRLMVTAFAEPGLMLTAINHGHVHRFLVKPMRPAELLSAVDDAIAEHLWSEESRDAPAPASAEKRMETNGDSPTVVEVPRGMTAPTVSIPWHSLADLMAPYREGALSSLLMVVIVDRPISVAARGGLEGVLAEHAPGHWMHVEGHQVAILAPGLSSRQGPLLRAAIRRALRDAQAEIAAVAAGAAELGSDEDVRKVGRTVEHSAQLAWAKERESVG